MYYSPPKSSVWGHSLRKMKPSVQRERLEAFLTTSVSAYSYATGSIYFQPTTFSPSESAEFDRHFTELLGLPEPQLGFSNLTEAQFELCFQQLLNSPSLYESGKRGATVTASYAISAWSIEGSSVETSSLLGVNYGGKPWLIPRFSFETIEMFEYLRERLEAAGLCKLNPKHIKGRGL